MNMRWPVLLVLLVQAVPALGQDHNKTPAPDEAAQAKAVSVIKEVYRADYESAKTNEQKASLAKKMLQDSGATKVAADRYALLRVSKDIASQAGDIDTAFAAISHMQAQFDVDGLVLKAGATASAGKSLRLPAEHKALAPYFLRLIDEAVFADRYDIAKDIGEAALESVRKARDSDSLKQLVEAKKRVEELERNFAEVQAALEVLEEKPTDPVANLTVGKFRCIVKEQWDAGLPMLALGSDQTLKSLAAKELADNPDALAVGDGWWDVAESLDGQATDAAQRRAAHWYRIILPALNENGLERKKIATRIAQAPVEANNLSDDFIAFTGTWLVVFSDWSLHWYIIDASGNIACGKTTGRLAKNGDDVVMQATDGSLHRVLLNDVDKGLLYINYFDSTENYVSGDAATHVGVGAKQNPKFIASHGMSDQALQRLLVSSNWSLDYFSPSAKKRRSVPWSFSQDGKIGNEKVQTHWRIERGLLLTGAPSAVPHGIYKYDVKLSRWEHIHNPLRAEINHAFISKK
jgi:hypothetical protein